jgi:RNA polymerase sigma-70 factor (ECF subfamily)
LGVGPDQAQELCQEAFLRLYAALRDGTEIENVRAWVFAVARNSALNERYCTRELEPFDDRVESHSAGASPTPEEQVLRAEKMRRLRAAVAELSPQQQQCLHLRADGFRYREIGRILGIRTSTVGEFLRRAVNRLREALHD